MKLSISFCVCVCVIMKEYNEDYNKEEWVLYSVSVYIKKKIIIIKNMAPSCGHFLILQYQNILQDSVINAGFSIDSM